MIRCAVATMAALAVTLVLGINQAVAAQAPGTPLAQVTAHDGISIPSSLAHAITQKLAVAPNTAPAPGAGAGKGPSQQELQASDGMPLDLLGVTVSLSGDGETALVGAAGRTVERRMSSPSAEAGGLSSRCSSHRQGPHRTATDTR